jgi:hypothetical protein
MLAVVHPEEEGETMRGREDGRSRLLKMDMVQCTWQVAVLMVQRQEDQDDGEHNACTEVCLCLSTIVPLLYADIVRHQFGRSMLIIEIVLSGSCRLRC